MDVSAQATTRTARHAIEFPTLKLVDGYESPYGMELLSSVHFLSHRQGIGSKEKMVAAVKEWNPEKKEKFSDEAICSAFDRLKEDGFIH